MLHCIDFEVHKSSFHPLPLCFHSKTLVPAVVVTAAAVAVVVAEAANVAAVKLADDVVELLAVDAALAVDVFFTRPPLRSLQCDGQPERGDKHKTCLRSA